jgi:hypothetical protein
VRSLSTRAIRAVRSVVSIPSAVSVFSSCIISVRLPGAHRRVER